LVITLARWPSTIPRTASLSSTWLQLRAPANRMWAPGAVAWTASTSSVSSPYQPLGPHAAASVNVLANCWLN
jgi:hypothetical protein